MIDLNAFLVCKSVVIDRLLSFYGAASTGQVCSLIIYEGQASTAQVNIITLTALSVP